MKLLCAKLTEENHENNPVKLVDFEYLKDN
jgi:hypothetical protein